LLAGEPDQVSGAAKFSWGAGGGAKSPVRRQVMLLMDGSAQSGPISGIAYGATGNYCIAPARNCSGEELKVKLMACIASRLTLI
jgi:hypothetical protein